MSVPIVEIITYIASETLVADTSLLKGPADYLKSTEGVISVFHGFQTEDPSRFYILIVWRTYEHFEKAVASESFPAFQASVKPFVGGDFSLRHILFDVDATLALSAPVTEISEFLPKEGHDQSEIDALIQQLRETAHLVPGSHPSPAWGKNKQSSEYIIAAGWDSLESHQSSVKVPAVQAAAEKLAEISHSSIRHVVLQKD